MSHTIQTITPAAPGWTITLYDGSKEAPNPVVDIVCPITLGLVRPPGVTEPPPKQPWVYVGIRFRTDADAFPDEPGKEV